MKLLKFACLLVILISSVVGAASQTATQIVTDGEKSLNAAIRSDGMNVAMQRFVTPDAECFPKGKRMNCSEWIRSSENLGDYQRIFKSTAVVGSRNGAMVVTVGFSQRTPEPVALTAVSQFIMVWMRQSDGKYKVSALFEVGDNSRTPSNPTPLVVPNGDVNERRISAADSAQSFFEKAAKSSAVGAYKDFMASDAVFIRELVGSVAGRDAALREVAKEKGKLVFNNRSVFLQAGDLAYVTNKYQRGNKSGALLDEGHLLQVWVFRDGRWQILFDAWKKSE